MYDEGHPQDVIREQEARAKKKFDFVIIINKYTQTKKYFDLNSHQTNKSLNVQNIST